MWLLYTEERGSWKVCICMHGDMHVLVYDRCDICAVGCCWMECDRYSCVTATHVASEYLPVTVVICTSFSKSGQCLWPESEPPVCSGTENSATV